MSSRPIELPSLPLNTSFIPLPEGGDPCFFFLLTALPSQQLSDRQPVFLWRSVRGSSPFSLRRACFSVPGLHFFSQTVARPAPRPPSLGSETLTSFLHLHVGMVPLPPFLSLPRPVPTTVGTDSVPVVSGPFLAPQRSPWYPNLPLVLKSPLVFSSSRPILLYPSFPLFVFSLTMSFPGTLFFPLNVLRRPSASNLTWRSTPLP